MNLLDQSFITGMITGAILTVTVCMGLIWAILAADDKRINQHRGKTGL